MAGTRLIAVAVVVLLVAGAVVAFLALAPPDIRVAHQPRLAVEPAPQLVPTPLEQPPPVTETSPPARGEADAQARDPVPEQARPKAAPEPAQAAEEALRLSLTDRQRLQVALSAQGYDTRGSDGVFGRRTREMIAAWQEARSLPPTGFVDSGQRQKLMTEAAAALGKYDEAQRKAQDERRMASRDGNTAGPGPAGGAGDPARPPPVEKWNWRARSIIMEGKSPAACRRSTRAASVYTLDYADGALTVGANNQQNASGRVAGDGSFSLELRPDTGSRLDILGNIKTWAFELFEPGEGCRWKLVPYDFLVHH